MQTTKEHENIVSDTWALLKSARFPLEGDALEDALVFDARITEMDEDGLRVLLHLAYNLIGTQNQLMALRVKTAKEAV